MDTLGKRTSDLEMVIKRTRSGRVTRSTLVSAPQKRTTLSNSYWFCSNGRHLCITSCKNDHGGCISIKLVYMTSFTSTSLQSVIYCLWSVCVQERKAETEVHSVSKKKPCPIKDKMVGDTPPRAS